LSTFDEEDILREPTVFCRLVSGESLPIGKQDSGVQSVHGNEHNSLQTT